jgi:small subunit ribosomal protein S2
MGNQVYKDMFDNAVHIGHRTQKWNPRMRKYIYGEQNGLHIINLEKTVEALDKAMDLLAKLAKDGKTVLFVSTKPQAVKLLEETAKSCGMPYVASKWISGLLTNFATVKTRIKYFVDLKEQEASGEFEKYKKKEVAKMKKTIDKLQLALGGVQNLKSKPDAVFLIDIVRDAIVVKEANKLKIPVIALVDTNADPSLIDYPIPANDDALKSIEFMLNKICESLGTPKAKK